MVCELPVKGDDAPLMRRDTERGSELMEVKQVYDIKCSVKSVKGFCSAGYTVGDHFFIRDGLMIEAGKPRGICMYALPALIPYLTAYCRETPEGDWINMKTELQCPDNDNAVIFGIERIER